MSFDLSVQQEGDDPFTIAFLNSVETFLCNFTIIVLCHTVTPSAYIATCLEFMSLMSYLYLVYISQCDMFDLFAIYSVSLLVFFISVDILSLVSRLQNVHTVSQRIFTIIILVTANICRLYLTNCRERFDLNSMPQQSCFENFLASKQIQRYSHCSQKLWL